MDVAEAARLEQQLTACFEGPAWHGPAVLEVLDGVTAEQAAAHAIAGAHSIWELVLHLSGTYRLVLRRLDGDPRQLSPDEDWPALPEPIEAEWQASVTTLRTLNARLRERVRDRAATLDADAPLIPEPAYTAFTQIVGMTQHDLYHAGQMALLRRAMGVK